MLLIDTGISQYISYKHTRNFYLWISVLYKQTISYLAASHFITREQHQHLGLFYYFFCTGLLIEFNIIESTSPAFVIYPNTTRDKLATRIIEHYPAKLWHTTMSEIAELLKVMLEQMRKQELERYQQHDD